VSSYRQAQREQRIGAIDPLRRYSPGEVSALLNISYSSALRMMAQMEGVEDFGTRERRYKRGKRKLRVLGKYLNEFLKARRTEVA
jgi:hypothetical protein